MPGTLPGGTAYGHRVQLKYADGVQLGRADSRALKAPRKSRTRLRWRCAPAAVLVGAFGAWAGAASASVEPFSAHLSRRAGDPPRWALVFTNQSHTVTRYSVCVERSSHADRRCWSRTVAAHRTSRVVIGAYPPGSWLAEWTSAGRRISRQFVVAGDELESLLRRVPLAKAKGILSSTLCLFSRKYVRKGNEKKWTAKSAVVHSNGVSPSQVAQPRRSPKPR
jgi:hypothetical protein